MNPANALRFELVSPEKRLIGENVAMVVLPGTEGNFGVLPGHAPFISSMRAGVIDVCANDVKDITRRIFVSGGLVEAGPERCTVLAEDAVPFEEVSKAAFAEQRRSLEERIGVVEKEEDREKMQAEIDILTRKIQYLDLIGHGK